MFGCFYFSGSLVRRECDEKMYGLALNGVVEPEDESEDLESHMAGEVGDPTETDWASLNQEFSHE